MESSPPLVRIRIALAAFMIGLVLSGLTAFPLLLELRLLAAWIGADSPHADGVRLWIYTVWQGLETTYAAYPWIAYGTDWLAFGHLVIAGFFIPALIDPARYVAVLYVGLAACVLVLPLALICGPIRGIPLPWRLIDCSFGLIGLVPLGLALRWTKQLAERD